MFNNPMDVDSDGGGAFSSFGGGMPGGSLGRRSRGGRQKDPPLEYDLNVSLEEVFEGTTKKMKITRKRKT